MHTFFSLTPKHFLLRVVHTCVLSTMHLEVRELEVSLVAAWIVTHEGSFLIAVWWLRNRGGDAGNPTNILKRRDHYSYLAFSVYHPLLNV